MKWSALWKILRIVSENAPAIIGAVQAIKHQDDQAPPPPPK